MATLVTAFNGRGAANAAISLTGTVNVTSSAMGTHIGLAINSGGVSWGGPPIQPLTTFSGNSTHTFVIPANTLPMPAVGTEKSYTITYYTGVTQGSGAGGTAGTVTVYNPASYLPPNAPIITSPSLYSEFYRSSSIGVSWTYQPGSAGMPQTSYRVAYRYDGYSEVTVASGSGATSSVTIQPYSISAPPSNRANLWIIVYTSSANGTSSATRQCYMLTSAPTKPVPSAPADNAISYPLAPTVVQIPYSASGGVSASSVRFEYRYSSSESWKVLTYSVSGSTLSFTVPASTFTIGAVQWRVMITNTLGENSEYSDVRTLHQVASAPLVPTLTRPTAGSTLYNHEPVTYGWTHNSNVSLGQFSFRLQWRVSGATSWTTVEQVSGTSQWIITHGALSAVIEWRVQTSNQYGEWSSYSVISSYTLATPYPEVTPMQPTGGYIDPTRPQLFEWSYSSPISAPMTDSELQYKLDEDASWTDAPVGNVTSLTIAANTLPVGRLLWRVRGQDSAGNWSAWTPETLIHTQDVAPDAPTPLAPIDVYIPVSDAIHFAWRHNSPIATPQGGADIAYSVDGGAEQLIHMDGSAQSYDTMPFMIVPGSVVWRVRTYNTEGMPGEWSATSAFSVTGAPITPSILSSSANGSRPGFSWVASGQIVYEVELRDELGNLLDLTERPAMDDQGAYIAPMYVPNGRYTLRVRAKNQYNFWSDWAQVAIVVAAEIRLGPAISASSRDYAIRIDLDGIDWEIVDHVLIYRDGVPVLRGSENYFLDFGAPVNITLRYYARAVYMDGSFADSDTVAAMLQFSGSVIAPAADLSQVLHIRINQDSGPRISSTAARDATLIPVAGQALPMVEYGEHLTRQFSVELAVRGSEDADALNAIYAETRPVLLRDVFGRHAWCRVASASDQSALTRIRAKARSLSLTLEQVAHDERVSID